MLHPADESDRLARGLSHLEHCAQEAQHRKAQHHGQLHQQQGVLRQDAVKGQEQAANCGQRLQELHSAPAQQQVIGHKLHHAGAKGVESF